MWQSGSLQHCILARESFSLRGIFSRLTLVVCTRACIFLRPNQKFISLHDPEEGGDTGLQRLTPVGCLLSMRAETSYTPRLPYPFGRQQSYWPTVAARDVLRFDLIHAGWQRADTMASGSTSKLAAFWNHPAGPKTIHFWAPTFKCDFPSDLYT